MFAVGLALLLFAVTLAWALRRRARRPSLAMRVEPLRAGRKHLAASVTELSDVGLHLPAASRALAGRSRLGALLGLR